MINNIEALPKNKLLYKPDIVTTADKKKLNRKFKS